MNPSSSVRDTGWPGVRDSRTGPIHIEADGDGPEGAIGQAHFFEHGVVVCLVQVASQGVEGAVEQ